MLTPDNLISLSKFLISSADTDINGRLRLGSLSNLLIQGAIHSADHLGFGYREMTARKLFWVLSRMTIEIYQPIHWYDQVEVETWPKDLDRLFYLRDFFIRNRDHTLMVAATSAWLAIDRALKRPRKVEGLGEEVFTRMRDIHAIKDPPEQLADFPAGESRIIKTTYFDIDLNKHVTSTRYLDWMMDTLPVDFHTSHYPARMSVNYLRETMPGEGIRLTWGNTGENKRYQFEGMNLDQDKPAFRGIIEF